MPVDRDEKDISSVAALRSGRLFILFESKPWIQVLLISLAAALLCLPCLFYGLPAGTNAPTHVKYQHHFSRQFWSGESYPRWLAEENKGYGSPIFLIQYPFPYFVTALLRPITSFSSAYRESRELGLFVCLAIAASGSAVWFWLRKLARPLAATLAALVYMSLPYTLGDGVYSRVAIGELCTFIWMPLVLLFCESMYQRRSAVFALSAIYGLLVISNLLSAVLFTPALTIYGVYHRKRFEQPLYRRVLWVLFAQLLGVGMAGAYILPLLAHRRLFDLHQMEAVLPGYQFGLYFLNMSSADVGTRFAIALGLAVLLAGTATWFVVRAVADSRVRIGMLLALAMGTLTLIPNLGLAIVRRSGFQLRPAPPNDFAAITLLGAFFTIVVALLAYSRAAESTDRRVSLLLGFAAVSFFLMLPFSAPLWRAIPGSSVIQFPFRLGGVLCVAVAGLLALAWDNDSQESTFSRRAPSRLVVTLATLAAITGGFLTWGMDRMFRFPKPIAFHVAGDIDPMYRAYVPLRQLPEFAKALGTTPDSYQVQPMPGDGSFRTDLVSGACDFNVNHDNPRELLVTSNCRSEGRLRIGQLYSPLWKIEALSTTPANATIAPSADGLMELKLIPGKQDLRLVFDLGPAERVGKLSTGASLVIGLLGFVYFRRRGNPSVARIQL